VSSIIKERANLSTGATRLIWDARALYLWIVVLSVYYVFFITIPQPFWLSDSYYIDLELNQAL